MPSEDLSTYAKSSVDFYDLLGISPSSQQKELDRAWRKTALKYHPDKVGASDITAKEKFHLAQIGYDLLSNPESKQIYDNARNARIQRQRQHEQYEGRRRQMKEDLEARERGVKRVYEETLDEEEKLRKELQRIAEDGKRRRKEREDALRKDLEQGEEQENGEGGVRASHQPAGQLAKSGVPDLDRTVQVRWAAGAEGNAVTARDVESLFARFGEIESADILGLKMARLKTSKKKQMVQRCALLYKSIVGALAAVEDFSKQTGPRWEIFDSVQWALNKEPESISNTSATATSDSAPRTAAARVSPSPTAAPRRFDGSLNGHDASTEKKPSFASFSTAAGMAGPKASSFGKDLGPNAPSLEEMTMIRLRKLEQKRLVAEIEQRDKEADAAAADGGNGRA